MPWDDSLDPITMWTRRYGRGAESAAAKDDLARMLEDMLAELDVGQQSPLLLLRSRFPQHSLVAGALRALLYWRQRRRLDNLWGPYHSLWRTAESLGVSGRIAHAPDDFVHQLRGCVQALLAFLRS